MSIGAVLSNLGVLVCFILGIIAMLKPEFTKSLVNLVTVNKEGTSEIQATYGGFFAGIAIYAFFVQSVEVFAVIGYGWLTAAVVRLVTIFKGAYSAKNIGGVLFESFIGVLCLAESIT